MPGEFVNSVLDFEPSDVLGAGLVHLPDPPARQGKTAGSESTAALAWRTSLVNRLYERRVSTQDTNRGLMSAEPLGGQGV